MERKISIVIGGKAYMAEYATIASAFLGFEDRGSFVAYLGFEGAAWGQSEDPNSWDASSLKYYIQKVLKTLGVNSWDRVVGKDVLVLRAERGGRVLGFAHATEDRYMLFHLVQEEAQEEASTHNM